MTKPISLYAGRDAYEAGYAAGVEGERRRAIGLPPPPEPPPTPPPACVAEVLAVLARATSDERDLVFQAVRASYCQGCGSDDPRCQCQNDE